MNFLKEQKAQTAIETLLIIVAAVVVAIIVGAYLKTFPGRVENEINNP
ncbi:MAG: class III signal peptide-containing protein [Candidatus Diapherotrites archaeon]